jgi:ADP-ribosyltransferase exoenzyme
LSVVKQNKTVSHIFIVFLTLYRGTENIELFNNPVFTEKGFMSTSLNESMAQKHIRKENGAFFKIHLQDSNINVLEVQSIFKESEYLIPRGIKFKVLQRGEEMNPLTNQLVPCIMVCPC